MNHAKGAAMSAADDTQTRELATRENDGLAVALLWHPREDALTVSIADARTGDRFRFEVDRNRALDAFYHPFAYAA
jgi:hypothetical protein